MDLDTVLRRNPDAAHRIYDGQATVVLPGRAEVKVLNEAGSLIWDKIDGVRTLGEILEAVLEDYDIDRARARDDLCAFVETLGEHGMVS